MTDLLAQLADLIADLVDPKDVPTEYVLDNGASGTDPSSRSNPPRANSNQPPQQP